MKDRIARYQAEVSASPAAVSQSQTRCDGEVLVELKDVNVSYHERKVSISTLLFADRVIYLPQVLQNTNWTVRAGERWHLQGSNGTS
jgi:ABC-type molybdenum transport system ATPase subunit/photorepair protein PhrA